MILAYLSRGYAAENVPADENAILPRGAAGAEVLDRVCALPRAGEREALDIVDARARKVDLRAGAGIDVFVCKAERFPGKVGFALIRSAENKNHGFSPYSSDHTAAPHSSPSVSA